MKRIHYGSQRQSRNEAGFIHFDYTDINLILVPIQQIRSNKFKMSIYSGFATRQQQHKYNGLIETLVIALKKRVIKFYAGEACDEGKFKMLVKKVYKKMFILEKGKYMAPKFTSCFTDLIDSLKIEINYDTMSECSSMMSQTFSLRKDSTELEGDQLRSNALLSNKRNLMEVKKGMNTSTMSLSKKDMFFKFDNEEEEIKRELIPRSTSLDPVDDNLKKLKVKRKLNELKNLKDMRGTMNMPRVEDFLPKKEQIQPTYNPRRNTFLQPKPNESPTQQNKMVFRRQKYSRPQVNYRIYDTVELFSKYYS